MKKLLLLLTSFLLISSFVFADDDDDFDDIFADAQDVEEAIVAETAATTPRVLSPFHVSGKLTADLGIVGYTENNKFRPGGYLSLDNYLYLDIRPNDSFQLHSSVHTTIQNLSISMESFYFDYFFLKNIFISAGLKGISWGYTRLFNSTDYYGTSNYGCGPQYTNVMADSGSYIVCQIRYPWSTGTLTLVPMCSRGAVTSGNIGYSAFRYAASVEQTLWNTSMNLFAKTSGGTPSTMNPLVGFEAKRTIFGFDVYGQGIVKIADTALMNSAAGYDYVTACAGFYRLWDAFDPNIGFNLEYQCTRRHATQTASGWAHLIAFEGGVKRMGKNKNHKIGLTWHHDILEQEGLLEFAYLISGIFPYANWSNGCKLNYRKGELPGFQVGTAISLDLSY